MAITPLPTAPSRYDPTNFTVRAEAFFAALVAMVGELNSQASSTVVGNASVSGNVVVGGATASPWGAGSVVVQAGAWAAFCQGSSGDTEVANNAYHNGSNWIRRNTAPAALYQQYSGQHNWFVASYGVSGSVIASWNQVAILDANGLLLINGAAIGYGQGNGGSVAQATSKSTTVTINKLSGQITMHGAALAAGASVFFTVANSMVGPNDVVKVSLTGGVASSYQNYEVMDNVCQAGSFGVKVKNVSGVSLSESLIINFVVYRGSAS